MVYMGTAGTLLIYRVGYKKVACLPFCKCPCYCINFCIYAMLWTRATFLWPTLRVGHEKVARTRAKRKAGYFFLAHSVFAYANDKIPCSSTLMCDSNVK